MFDFDFSFNKLKIDDDYVFGTLLRQESKERIFFDPDREVRQVRALIPSLPKENQTFKMLSLRGGFSSLAIILRVAQSERIERMYCSTFRIGRRHFDRLRELKEEGMLGVCWFLTSKTQENTDRLSGYDYLDYIRENRDEWKVKAIHNHSKVILMETRENWYVVETSSNLNENPQIEQFSFENDRELFNWHLKLFRAFFDDIE